jgi:type I restriction enzyme S subunit
MLDEQLPEGWVWTTLGEISTKPQYGWTTKAQHTDGTILLLRTTDISSGTIDWDSVPYCTELPENLADYLLQTDDIVISRAGSVGVSYLLKDIPKQTVFASYLIRFHPLEGIEAKYIAYYLQTSAYWNRIYEESSGIALANVNASKLETIEIPLPSSNEQARIVAAIEQQFARLDSAVASLKSAQAKIPQYRASLLKSAVEGELTREWRAAHPAEESGADLLKRILAERRARWEQAQLAKMHARGEMPWNDEWKKAYKEPEGPDVENLPALPEGWCWATVEQLAAAEENSITDGPFGSNLKTEHYKDRGPRVIRLQNIGDGFFRDEKAFISQDHFAKLPKYEIFAGDLVIAALGENPPRSCIIPDFVGLAIVKADCIRYKVSPHVLNSYVNIVLNSEPTKRRTSAMLHGMGRPRLNLSEIKSIVLPLPPLAEQAQIVAEVEAKLSEIAKMEEVIEHSLRRAELERQSILREAFAGRLVEQNPEDEPASVLLERIREECRKRAELEKERRKGERTMRKQEFVYKSVEAKLYHKLAEARAPMEPGELFRQAGFKIDTEMDEPEPAEQFFTGVDHLAGAGAIAEERPDDRTVLLRTTDLPEEQVQALLESAEQRVADQNPQPGQADLWNQ